MIAVSVDSGRCQGAGQCLMNAPAVFDLGDDGTVRLLQDRVEDAEGGALDAAVQLCPAQAITLHRH